jgi:hypothetical protein
LKRLAAAVATLALCGCLPPVELSAQAAEPKLDPIAFFTGLTEGRGTLSTITGRKQSLHVVSVGRPRADGSLVLDQRIALSGEPVRDRRWTIRPAGPGRYAGTLTEALGTVDARVSGNRMTIRYRTENYAVRQQLALTSGGELRNRFDAVKWGLNVARLDERISRVAPSRE